MSRVLVTGGSGFLGMQIIFELLARDVPIVATVRSAAKKEALEVYHASIPEDKLTIIVVPDISVPGALDKVVKCEPPLTGVIHAAAPYHYNIHDLQKDMLDPAVNGTLNVLKAVSSHAPTVESVVMISSFAAMSNPTKPAGTKYSEEDWNPMDWAQAKEEQCQRGQPAYRLAKTLAEKAAWEFVVKERPSYNFTVLLPSLMLGQVSQLVWSAAEINTSNQRIRDFISGACREKCPKTGSQFWVDVRDVALAAVRALRNNDLNMRRVFLTAGPFCNREIVESIYKCFSELRDRLPQGADALRDGEYPEGGPTHGYDNSLSRKMLGIEYHTLDSSIVEAVRSIRSLLQPQLPLPSLMS